MTSKKTAPTLPEGYKTKEGVAWGSRVPGLLEISFWNLKQKNSVTPIGQYTIGRVINDAQNDENVKVIFIHGGLFYGSGNDLKLLSRNGKIPKDEYLEESSLAVQHHLVSGLMAIH